MSLYTHTNVDYENDWRKRCVLSDFLKLFKVMAVTTDAGRLFQILAAAAGKALSPMVDSRVRGTNSSMQRGPVSGYPYSASAAPFFLFSPFSARCGPQVTSVVGFYFRLGALS